MGLPHRRGDVGHARPGDDETGCRPSRDAGIAVGHEAGPLLVAGGDVGHAAAGQAAIELHRVDAGDAEGGVDAARRQEPRQDLSEARHQNTTTRARNSAIGVAITVRMAKIIARWPIFSPRLARSRIAPTSDM